MLVKFGPLVLGNMVVDEKFIFDKEFWVVAGLGFCSAIIWFNVGPTAVLAKGLLGCTALENTLPVF